jgi:hypothetical protein
VHRHRWITQPLIFHGPAAGCDRFLQLRSPNISHPEMSQDSMTAPDIRMRAQCFEHVLRILIVEAAGKADYLNPSSEKSGDSLRNMMAHSQR